MTAFLIVPSDLTPTELAYLEDLPDIIKTIIEECREHRKRGDTDSAIRCARQAQELAQAQNDHVSASVASVLLADVYRELDQIGLALECCQKAHDVLRLEPNCVHRRHAEAVITYLRCLLHHVMGAHTRAFADYQQAITAFDKAKEHWNNSIARDHAKADEYRKMVNKCEKATKWINALYRCLASDLSPIRGGTEIHVPATNGEDYELARMELATCLLPLEVNINRKKYQLHHPNNGSPFAPNDRLEVQWDTRHFVVHVSDTEPVVPHSSKDDYILVTQEKQMRERVAQMLQGPPPQPRIAGVLRKEDQQEWEYGDFTYDAAEGVRFHPLPPIVIGGAQQDEEIEDQDIGVVCALLKLV
jgi:hypothetical protein